MLKEILKNFLNLKYLIPKSIPTNWTLNTGKIQVRLFILVCFFSGFFLEHAYFQVCVLYYFSLRDWDRDSAILHDLAGDRGYSSKKSTTRKRIYDNPRDKYMKVHLTCHFRTNFAHFLSIFVELTGKPIWTWKRWKWNVKKTNLCLLL